MVGFTELAEHLNTDDGVGRLLAVNRMRRKAPIDADDLLACEDLEVLALEFEGSTFYCFPRGMDDTLELRFELPVRWDRPVTSDLSQLPPWRCVLGTELFRAWALDSSTGYHDAVQFSFAPVDDPRHQIIQLETVASLIRVSTVTPV